MIFIIARHGDYADDDGMNERGSLQAIALAKTMKEKELLPQPEKCRVVVELISSSAPRALQFARVLGGQIDVTARTEPVLWSDMSHPEDPGAVLQLIETLFEERRKPEVVILVTHLEYSRKLPRLLAQRFCGKDVKAPWRETEYAEAHVLNTETGEFSKI